MGVVQEVIDAAGEMAFEAADCFAVDLAIGALSGEVDGGAGVVSDADHSEHVEGAIERRLPPLSEAVSKRHWHPTDQRASRLD